MNKKKDVNEHGFVCHSYIRMQDPKKTTYLSMYSHIFK